MDLHINNLSDDLVKYIFDYLDPKKFSLIQSVCVKKLLAQKTNLNREDDNQLLDKFSNKFVSFDQRRENVITIDNTIRILMKILTLKRTNVETFKCQLQEFQTFKIQTSLS